MHYHTWSHDCSRGNIICGNNLGKLMTHISSNFDSNKSMSPEVSTFTVQKNPQGTQQKHNMCL